METYHGQVRTPQDAVVLFEACRMGMLPRVQRRLSEKERQSIRSGSIFVWDEREAGMRRWTDGKSWSASRVSGSFLTYREMEGKRGSSTLTPPTKMPDNRRNSGEDTADGEEGPDGYRYKPDGLMKQSFSITTSTNQHLHLISYFSRAHPTAPGLPQPTTDLTFRLVRPAKGLYPETAFHDPSNVVNANRSPLAGPAPYDMPSSSPAAYPRPTPGFAYGPHPHPIPIQSMSNSVNGHPARPYVNGHGGPLLASLPHYRPPPASLPPHPPMIAPEPLTSSLDQRAPPRNGEFDPNHLAQQRSNPIEHSSGPSQIPTLPHPPDRRSSPSAAPTDPRLAGSLSSRTQSAPHLLKDRAPSPANSSLPATRDSRSKTDIPPRARTELASIERSMAMSTPAVEYRVGRRQSPSPGRGSTATKIDGPADIPSQKLAFGEDQRALKALDKVFI